MRDVAQLKEFLDEKVDLYNRRGFIENDPIQIPHSFKKLQDIEISAFFAATLAWGQRKTIISKCKELMTLMDNAPHDFVLNHSVGDLNRLATFKHRTFNTTDLLYFVHFFNQYYQKEKSLETAFVTSPQPALAVQQAGPGPLSNLAPPKRFPKARGRGGDHTMKIYLINFHKTFFSLDDSPSRTRKHIATPERKSACKRINMFLRWMVRSDDRKVDFGLWKNISPAQLICPIDLHVERIARKLNLIKRKQVDWQTAEELTANLRKLDPADPVKYDFALFGLGIDGF